MKDIIPEEQTPPKQNDELLKGAFEEWFVEFLYFLYPQADTLFNLGRGLTFMDKELLAIIPDRERKKGKRVADLLVKVYLTDGSEKWILLHTEIEGGNQDGFAFRLFQYHYRLLDRYRVPIETIVVFTGDENQKTPREYRYQGIDTSIFFRYRAYHIFDHSAEQLLGMGNVFGLIALACQKSLREGKVPEKELGEYRSTIARAMITSGKYDKDHITSFSVFLKNFLFIKNEKINRNFDTLIYQETGGAIDMGIIEAVKRQERQAGKLEGKLEGKREGKLEGRVEGKLEGKTEVVTNLLQANKFSIPEIANFASVTEDFVKKVQADLLRKKK